jgi:hypothetical protein
MGPVRLISHLLTRKQSLRQTLEKTRKNKDVFGSRQMTLLDSQMLPVNRNSAATSGLKSKMLNRYFREIPPRSKTAFGAPNTQSLQDFVPVRREIRREI